MLVIGTGEAWIDDVSIDVVGVDVSLTSAFAPSRDAANVATQTAQYAPLPLAFTNFGFEAFRR